MPDATHTGFTDADGGGHGAGAPVSGVGWLVTSGHLDYASDLASANGALRPGSRRIFLEPGQAQSQVALAPARNFFGSHSQILSNSFCLARPSSRHHAGAFDNARMKGKNGKKVMSLALLPVALSAGNVRLH